LRGTRGLYFAGQITGAEGYVEAAACGAMTGIHAAREILRLPAIEFPRETAFGAVVAHLQNRHTADFQPSNVTWGSFPVVLRQAQHDNGAAQQDNGAVQHDNGRGQHDKGLGKRERRRMMAERALAAIERFVSETVMARVG
jgi:folate-dependent tRNA-U54 methylase TrmFO/GidA